MKQQPNIYKERNKNMTKKKWKTKKQNVLPQEELK